MYHLIMSVIFYFSDRDAETVLFLLFNSLKFLQTRYILFGVGYRIGFDAVMYCL